MNWMKFGYWILDEVWQYWMKFVEKDSYQGLTNPQYQVYTRLIPANN
jgi:hypothetical protein